MVPTLTTSRLLLHEIMPNDQAFIFKGLSHPDVIPFYGVRYDSFEAAAVQMEWYQKMVAEGTGLPWKISLMQTGETIGVISVYLYQPEHQKAEIGFWLLPQFWNKGFALEALNAVTSYWKAERGLHRLEAFVEEGNDRSSKLLENAGFLYEGTMRECEIKNGNYISLRIYAILLQSTTESVKSLT